MKNLRENAREDCGVVQRGLGKIEQEALSANGRLSGFIASADASSVEDSAALAAKVCRMEEILESWYVSLRIFSSAVWAWTEQICG